MGNNEAWLVVADSNNRRVQVLTREGTVMHVLQDNDGIKLGISLGGVTVCLGTGEVLVTDCLNHRVVSWRLSDGGGLRVVCGGVQGSESGQLSLPIGLVAFVDGSLFVGNYGTSDDVVGNYSPGDIVKFRLNTDGSRTEILRF